MPARPPFQEPYAFRLLGKIPAAARWMAVGRGMANQLRNRQQFRSHEHHAARRFFPSGPATITVIVNGPKTTIYIEGGDALSSLYMESGMFDLHTTFHLAADSYLPADLYYGDDLRSYRAAAPGGPTKALLGRAVLVDKRDRFVEGRSPHPNAGVDSKSLNCDDDDKVDFLVVSDLFGNTAEHTNPNPNPEGPGLWCPPPEPFNQKRAQAFYRPSLFSGKLRMMVQGLYGTERTDYKLDEDVTRRPFWKFTTHGSSAQQGAVFLDWDFRHSSGIYTDIEGKYWLIQIRSGLAYFRRIITKGKVERWRRALNDPEKAPGGIEERLRWETYILSHAEVDDHRPIDGVISEYDLPCTTTWEPQFFPEGTVNDVNTINYGIPWGYGWKFNWPGNEATWCGHRTHPEKNDSSPSAGVGDFLMQAFLFHMTISDAGPFLPNGEARPDNERLTAVITRDGPYDWIWSQTEGYNPWAPALSVAQTMQSKMPVLSPNIAPPTFPEAPLYSWWKDDPDNNTSALMTLTHERNNLGATGFIGLTNSTMAVMNKATDNIIPPAPFGRATNTSAFRNDVFGRSSWQNTGRHVIFYVKEDGVEVNRWEQHKGSGSIPTGKIVREWKCDDTGAPSGGYSSVGPSGLNTFCHGGFSTAVARASEGTEHPETSALATAWWIRKNRGEASFETWALTNSTDNMLVSMILPRQNCNALIMNIGWSIAGGAVYGGAFSPNHVLSYDVYGNWDGIAGPGPISLQASGGIDLAFVGSGTSQSLPTENLAAETGSFIVLDSGPFTHNHRDVYYYGQAAERLLFQGTEQTGVTLPTGVGTAGEVEWPGSEGSDGVLGGWEDYTRVISLLAPILNLPIDHQAVETPSEFLVTYKILPNAQADTELFQTDTGFNTEWGPFHSVVGHQ